MGSKPIEVRTKQSTSNIHLSEQETKPFNVGLRQVRVERGMASGSKGRREDNLAQGCNLM